MKKNLVIGLGEIGTAIAKILECPSWDISDSEKIEAGCAVLHICFPYSKRFVEAVKDYQIYHDADLVIVHSTVPMGTCSENGWVHSPVRGIHPHLEEGIRTFVKFFGGDGAMAAAKIFRAKGIKTMCSIDARETEAMKLWDTTIYGWNILIEKAIKAYCEKNDLDFKMVYKMANQTYNEGYAALGHPEFTKYVLKDFPGPIGGHCVRENWELLDDPLAGIAKSLHKRITDSPTAL